nr:hypothetical protein [Tanacetum cinerariifolium]
MEEERPHQIGTMFYKTRDRVGIRAMSSDRGQREYATRIGSADCQEIEFSGQNIFPGRGIKFVLSDLQDIFNRKVAE